MRHGYRYDEKGDFFSSYLERQHIGVTGHFTTISADFYLRHLITRFGFIQCISLNVHRFLPSKYKIVFSQVHSFIAEQLNRYLHAFISKIVEMGETCRDKPRNQVLP